MAKKPSAAVRVLMPFEYPPQLTGARGAYTPKVKFAAQHPLGLYHVEDQGAGYHMAYFTPKRKGSRAKPIGAGNSLAGALARIAEHEGDELEPNAPRETGANGPVSIFAVGRRTTPKKETQLDRELAAFVAKIKES